MATLASLQFEMERRSILFTANTTMPDSSLLGFEGNPNSIISPSTAGETLIYNCPQGTHYLELSNGTLWFKEAMPNSWTSIANSQDLNSLSGYANNTFATITNLELTGFNLQNEISNLYSGITGIDLSLSNYATIANLESTGQNLQNQINNIDNIYATDISLAQTGQSLDQKINSLSGYFNEENILEYTAELGSGSENAFLIYPVALTAPPSSIICSFQNVVDNVIYNYAIGQITQSGFYINFSDILTNSGYFLKIQVKKNDNVF